MPIKGLSETRRITRGGYIRLGEMKVSPRTGAEYPSAVDYFIPDFEDQSIQETFRELYGDRPRRITVAPPPPGDPAQFFPQWYKCYGKTSGLKCKGDGEQAQRSINGGMEEISCPGPDACDFGKEHGCRAVASLQVFIKGLPTLEVFQINTGSRNSIINLNSGIDMLQWLRGGRGIAGVWVDLVIVPQEATVDGKKKNIYVMKLIMPVGLDDVQKLTSAVETVEPLALPVPDDSRDPYIQPKNGHQEDHDKPAESVPGFDTDRDVVTALDQAGMGEAARAAMLRSAEAGNWSKDQLLATIQKHAANNKSRASGPSQGTGTGTEKPNSAELF